MKWRCALVGLLAQVMWVLPASAVSPTEQFLSDVFAGDVPSPQALWLRDEARQVFESALGHPSPLLRVRYWQRDARTVWILDEIGKEQPITTGIVVSGGKIERIKVITFRESRGGEVQRESFVAQFVGVLLDDSGRLSQPIDGITGATLSVYALQRQARAALALERFRLQQLHQGAVAQSP